MWWGYAFIHSYLISQYFFLGLGFRSDLEKLSATITSKQIQQNGQTQETSRRAERARC